MHILFTLPAMVGVALSLSACDGNPKTPAAESSPSLPPQSAGAPAASAKPPFKVFHSNDTTNIGSCPAPWKNAANGLQDPEYIRHSVRETANSGIDVHMLQPGMGWVPWWPSPLLDAHIAWKRAHGLRVDGWYEQPALDGHDFVAAFVDECRKQNEHPFVSFRMNDQHHIYAANSGKLPNDEFEKRAGIFQFYAEHPEWRIGEDGFSGSADKRSMDFRFPEVRAYRLAQIRELIERYDIDGFEMDFMRHWALFNQQKTTPEQRADIFTDMVKTVRGYLDEKGKKVGRKLYLGVRIPAYTDAYAAMGIDLKRLAEEGGVDIVNASGHYFTDDRLQIAKMRAQLPERVGLYVELQYTNAIGPVVDIGGGKQHWPARRCTPLQQYTAAYLARQRGADGVSTFNYQYYRGTDNPSDVLGTPAEPPYEIFKNISDVAWLARQPQHYAVAFIWNSPHLKDRPFQKPILRGKPVSVTLDMAPPEGGWQKDGTLRIQARASLKGTTWRARLNGTELAASPNVAEPFPNPYDVALGSPQDYRAWTIPHALVKDGENTFDLLLENGAPEAFVFFMDAAFPR